LPAVVSVYLVGPHGFGVPVGATLATSLAATDGATEAATDGAVATLGAGVAPLVHAPRARLVSNRIVIGSARRIGWTS
jgi:hypothetical protein